MTPEEILEKIGLNGKILKKFSLGKLLTDADATHATVINDVGAYLKSLNIPTDLITKIQEPLAYELLDMVPESSFFKDFLRNVDVIGSRITKFQNTFNNVVKGHLRLPLSMDTSEKLKEGSQTLEKLFDELKEVRPPGDPFAEGLSNTIDEFDDFQIGIFDKKFDSTEKINNYIETNVGKPSQYVDDLVLPEGFTTGDVTPPGMSFMGSEVPTEKLITGPFDDLISFTAAQELKPFINPELAEKAAKILESSQEIGEQIVSSAKKLTNDAIRISGKAAGALDPGDVVLSRAIPKLLTGLGVGSLSSGALTLYAIYEGALILADVVDGLEEAVTNMDDNESIKDFGKDFWQGFTDDSLSEKYSLSYKLTEPIHNRLFGNVYDTMAETPMTPVTAGGGGGRAKIL